MVTGIILFIFGLAIGSFLNVVALRYDGERFVMNPAVIGGRSHCLHCGKTLRWFELFPVLSFIIQRGRCRSCCARIGFRYAAVELLSGAIFAFVPLRFAGVAYVAAHPASFALLAGVWIAAFEILLLISYIDILLGIIPDELNVALGIVGFLGAVSTSAAFGAGNVSFLGAYAAVFGLQQNILTNHVIGAIFGVAFFGGIVALTRGRGMGMGDVKLALPLGLLFGWPDILVITMMAFIIGGILGAILVGVRRKTMQSSVPFGPFLVAASVIVFFAGSSLSTWYFHMLGL